MILAMFLLPVLFTVAAISVFRLSKKTNINYIKLHADDSLPRRCLDLNLDPFGAVIIPYVMKRYINILERGESSGRAPDSLSKGRGFTM